MKIEKLIQKIEEAQSKYNDYMTDMCGEWLYNDRYEIEQDLGMTLEDFDDLTELKNSLKILLSRCMSILDNYSAKELALILKFNLNE